MPGGGCTETSTGLTPSGPSKVSVVSVDGLHLQNARYGDMKPLCLHDPGFMKASGPPVCAMVLAKQWFGLPIQPSLPTAVTAETT